MNKNPYSKEKLLSGLLVIILLRSLEHLWLDTHIYKHPEREMQIIILSATAARLRIQEIRGANNGRDYRR